MSKTHKTRDSLSSSCSHSVFYGLSSAILSQFALEVCTGAENRKKTLKHPILKVQGYSRSSMLIKIKSSSPLLVMISSMSMPICNCFHVRRANIGKITNFLEGHLFLTLASAGLLEPTGSGLELLKFTFYAENFICRLSWSIYLQPFRRNSLLKCARQPKIAKKFTKTPLLGVQNRSKSSMLTNLKSP